METTSPHMPSDIVINILSRLPVKSLIRFRCVCKSWHDLISDPNFIDMHLKFNQTVADDKGYIVANQPEKRYFKDDEDEPFNTLTENFHVEGYCNGLICISCPDTRSSLRDIYLWNPAIHKFKALPESVLFGGVEVLGFMFVIFGFFPLIDDYRVVKIVQSNKFGFKGPPKVEIYSLRLNSWKEIRNIVPCRVHCNTIEPIVNGLVHWVATRREIEEYSCAEFILTFDMANEVFGEMKLPEFCHNEYVGDKSLIRLKESLSLFVHYQEGMNDCVDIWVMKDYGAAESWTKQFTLDCWVSGYPLGFLKNGEVVLRHGSDKLVSYDSTVNQVKDLQITGVTTQSDAFIYYVESLVLLNQGN